MTIFDFRCDRCGAGLAGLQGVGPTADSPRAGIRFRYHPGDPALGDDGGLMCPPCWSEASSGLADPDPQRCAACGADLRGRPALQLSQMDQLRAWALCTGDALDWLNRLRTVDPKLDPATFVLPAVPDGMPADEPEPGWVSVELTKRERPGA